MSHFVYNPRTVGKIKLHAKTMAPETIAAVMRCSVGTIELICRKHGIEMRDRDQEEAPPKTARERSEDRKLLGTHVRIYLDQVVLVAVSNEAKRRGTVPSDLIATLVETVVQDRMFSAVLEK